VPQRLADIPGRALTVAYSESVTSYGQVWEDHVNGHIDADEDRAEAAVLIEILDYEHSYLDDEWYGAFKAHGSAHPICRVLVNRMVTVTKERERIAHEARFDCGNATCTRCRPYSSLKINQGKDTE
jgi:hypothetical protein